MAALAKLVLKRRNLLVFGENLFGAKLYTSQPLPESSFAQRLRDLPKDLPGTNIKRDASQVCLDCSNKIGTITNSEATTAMWCTRVAKPTVGRFQRSQEVLDSSLLSSKGSLSQTVHASFGERYLSSVLFEKLRKEAKEMQPVSVD